MIHASSFMNVKIAKYCSSQKMAIVVFIVPVELWSVRQFRNKIAAVNQERDPKGFEKPLGSESDNNYFLLLTIKF